MSYLLFVDESGHDQRESPYEVLAGIVIEDSDLWPLICEVQSLEETCFGCRYADDRELKGKKILKRKVFRQAASVEPLPADERQALARECLSDGAGATPRQVAALAQAKLEFVRQTMALCNRYGCKAIASLVPRGAPRPTDDVLRKDYSYLFERFFYFLDEQQGSHQGLVVFDELERSQSHLLISQMARYFSDFHRGRERSRVVIPEPFFVHSHLTTGVQLADLIAYIAAWGMQIGSMPPAERSELEEFGSLVADLEHHSTRRNVRGWHRTFTVHSLTVIEDLRPASGTDVRRSGAQTA